MIDIPMRTQGAWDQDTIRSMNTQKTGQIYDAQNITGLNRSQGRPGGGPSGRPVQRTGTGGGSTPQGGPVRSGQRLPDPAPSASPSPVQPPAAPPQMRIPPLMHPIRKGQKVPLAAAGSLRQADICLGWNSRDARCDVDVSAFLLGESGKVIGDDWFVFYRQTKSPDGSTVFEMDGTVDREVIRLDLTRLDPAVKKIVFVLTINEAVEKRLHFGMLKDAYIRILDHEGRTELASFLMTDYYTNVISMMIGELYLHNGGWKFHGIGNGVAKDLAGLCELYGVQVSG